MASNLATGTGEEVESDPMSGVGAGAEDESVGGNLQGSEKTTKVKGGIRNL